MMKGSRTVWGKKHPVKLTSSTNMILKICVWCASKKNLTSSAYIYIYIFTVYSRPTISHQDIPYHISISLTIIYDISTSHLVLFSCSTCWVSQTAKTGPIHPLRSTQRSVHQPQIQGRKTYCWWKKCCWPVEVGTLSHCLQGFIHPRWCKLSSINGIVRSVFFPFFGRLFFVQEESGGRGRKRNFTEMKRYRFF